ncbi:MAG: signal peptidase I [Deltaproteobacteria bacterium]|nr:signal peptidase I [Deltaproteobacteria bacterium]
MENQSTEIFARSRALAFAKAARRAALYPWLTRGDKLDMDDKKEILEAAERVKNASEPGEAGRALAVLEDLVGRTLFPVSMSMSYGELQRLKRRIAEAKLAMQERKDVLKERDRKTLKAAIDRAENARNEDIRGSVSELDDLLEQLFSEARPTNVNVDKRAKKLIADSRKLLSSKKTAAVLNEKERTGIEEAIQALDAIMSSASSSIEKGKALRRLQDYLDLYGWKVELGRSTVKDAKRLVHEATRLLKKKRVRLVLGRVRQEELESARDRTKELLKKTRIIKLFATFYNKDAKAEYMLALQQIQESAQQLDDLIKRYLGLFMKSSLREYVESIGGAILIALAIRAFLFEPFRIPSGSMLPTLEIGDHIFVNKYEYGLRIPFFNAKVFYKDRLPSRGDVIVFVQPETGEDYIKRVIGLPGDVVEVVGGTRLFINGREAHLEQKGTYVYPDRETGWLHKTLRYDEDLMGKIHSVIYEPPYHRHGPSGRWQVKPGHVLVMGDNRDNSYDSRSWGQVPLENIKGRAIFIWFAWGNWHRYGMKIR